MCVGAGTVSLNIAREGSAEPVQWGRPVGQHGVALPPLRICGYVRLELIDNRVEELVEFPDQHGDSSARRLLDVVTVGALRSRWQVIEPHGRLHKQRRPQVR
jgi:hypothetical protein